MLNFALIISDKMIEKNKALFTTIGFLLFVIGFLALVLSMIGLKLSYLTWIDAAGSLVGLVIRLVMIFGGIVLVVLARSDFKGENEYIN